MFGSVLIANRGEIALRIMRTAKRMGLRTIAVYSQADASAPHVVQADEAYVIGPAAAAESYLNGARILEVARASGAECLHPGYGFLAENADFAEACAEAGVVFVGPPPKAIRLMGLKHEAKALMGRAGVPVAPGYDGADQSPKVLLREAKRIGYPVMLKPVAGGGGKGMRRVGAPEELSAALESAKREALSSFGDDRVLIEKYLERPRHIEIQVFADTQGNAVHLFERDCSLQRRHQKIIEEAPAPGMTPGLRARMTEAAIAAARTVGYEGAGTVEFLVGGNALSDASRFYFLEMNTRLQVEHPVTEAITGLDLVEWQFRVAAGEPLPVSQEDIRLVGHAVEARLYAEDPEHGFLPSTGRLHALRWPEGAVRIDTGVAEGGQVTPHYDPLIAKMIAHGEDRQAAMAQLVTALENTLVAGPRTNLAFLHALLRHDAVAGGEVDTGLVDREAANLTASRDDATAMRAGVAALLERKQGAIVARGEKFDAKSRSPWDAADAFELGPPRRQTLTVLIDDEPRQVEVTWPAWSSAEREIAIVPAGNGIIAVAGMRQTHVQFPDAAVSHADAGDEGGTVRAPMHGRIAKVWAAQGQNVKKGDRLAVLEAMKMEHVLHAPRDGTVLELSAKEGVQLEQGAIVAVIGSEDDA